MDPCCPAFWLKIFVCLMLTSGQVFGQLGTRSTLPDANIEVAATADLDRAREFLADEQWVQAVGAIRRVSEGTAGELAPMTLAEGAGEGGLVRFVPVRKLGQLLLARYNEALREYRRQVDPLAKQWFDQAAKDNREQLERIVSELFLSSYGDDALLRLGDRALERGSYTIARGHWQRISPALTMPLTSDLLRVAAGMPLWLALRGRDFEDSWPQLEAVLARFEEATPTFLTYPNTDLDLAGVRARLVLVSILEGSVQQARVELQVLERLHGQATGTIAGQQGRYVELLGSLLEQSLQWEPPTEARDWPTFGGASSRCRTANGRAELLRPLWKVGLPRLQASRELIGFGRPRVAESSTGLLSHHPLVARELVLWNDASSVYAHRLVDDQTVWETVDAQSGWRIAGTRESPDNATTFQPRRRHVGVPRFTMTSHRNRLFARLGDGVTSSRDIDADRVHELRSRIVGLDLSKQGRQLPGFPIRPDGLRWEFEGAPLTDGSRLYVAMRHSSQSGAMPELYVVCYDLATAQGDPVRLRWRVKVCSADTPAGSAADEYTHCLLTLYEGIVLCNTNLGAVAAMSADDGLLQWLVRYPRSQFKPSDPDRTDWHYFRDLTPCMCYKDLVLVAPTDYAGIFALDVVTGRIRWTSRLVDVNHLLGVGAESLIASGVRLYWIDIHSGQIKAQVPRPGGKLADGFARPEPSGYGRGILVEDRVYWPTRNQILIFDQRTVVSAQANGPTIHRPRLRQTIQLDRPDLGITGGNLVMANDVLLVAGADALYALGQRRSTLRTANRVPQQPQREAISQHQIGSP